MGAAAVKVRGASAHWLTGPRRLRLCHGPIDLIIQAEGPASEAAYLAAMSAFEPVLDDLVAELPALRSEKPPMLSGPVARRMKQAIAGYDVFVTPMAAVAGSVADHVLAAMLSAGPLNRVMVNNGGDIALFHAPGHGTTIASMQPFPPYGRLATIRAGARDGIGGIATSGWRGRSHSLGIADAVTVLAPTAAAADVAATLIANAVDVPGHRAINREPANSLAPDSDLGTRPVTTHVGQLGTSDIEAALAAGADCARSCLARGVVSGVLLALQGRYVTFGRGLTTPALTAQPGD